MYCGCGWPSFLERPCPHAATASQSLGVVISSSEFNVYRNTKKYAIDQYIGLEEANQVQTHKRGE